MTPTNTVLKPTTKVGIFIRLEWGREDPQPVEHLVRIFFNDLFPDFEITGGILYRLEKMDQRLLCCDICRNLVMHPYSQSHHPEVLLNKQKLFSFLKPLHSVSVGHKECLQALRIHDEQPTQFQYVDDLGAEISIYTSKVEAL